MKWWDDLWLNESFATFMAAKAEDAMFPKWKTWEEFVRLDTAGALSRDSLLNTHPIEVKVNSPSEIEEVFDDISYGKGASVIRMLEAYTGEENFMKGVRSYLQKYKYSNAAGIDLWTQIEEASKAQVKRVMSEWIKKPGYPVLSVSLKSGKIAVRQERFLFSGRAEKTTWPVPITMRLNGATKRLLMDKEEELVDVPGKVESVKLNVDQTGFYSKPVRAALESRRRIGRAICAGFSQEDAAVTHIETHDVFTGENSAQVSAVRRGRIVIRNVQAFS